MFCKNCGRRSQHFQLKEVGFIHLTFLDHDAIIIKETF